MRRSSHVAALNKWRVLVRLEKAVASRSAFDRLKDILATQQREIASLSAQIGLRSSNKFDIAQEINRRIGTSYPLVQVDFARTEIYLERGLYFQPGASSMTPASEAVCDQLAGVLKVLDSVLQEYSQEAVHARLEGHIHLNRNSVLHGTQSWQTSMQRAQAVVSTLSQKGVRRELLHPIGMGVASINTTADPDRNRRVQVKLMSPSECVEALCAQANMANCRGLANVFST
jgi:outer membrane protein OmpA-like peptidoglycan-associated protein